MTADQLILLVSIILMLIAMVSAVSAALLFLLYPRQPKVQPTHFSSSGFDTAPLRPRLDAVRNDYNAALHLRPHPKFHPQELLEAARKNILRLAYFQDHEIEK